jgi:hypothetical protein
MVDVSRDDLSATVLAVANEAVISSAQEQASVMEELRALDQQLAHLTTMHTKLSGDPESARSELHAEFNAQVTRIESMRECLGMDFGALQQAYSAVLGGRHADVSPSAEFLGKFAEVERTTVKGGYNPMLEDFENTRFFTSS